MKSGKGPHSETCEYDCGYAHLGKSKSCGTFIAILLWWLFFLMFIKFVSGGMLFLYISQLALHDYNMKFPNLTLGNRFNEQNNNSARAWRFFVHFFAVPAQQRRKMTKFEVYLRTGTARQYILPSLSKLGRSPLSSAPTKIPFF